MTFHAHSGCHLCKAALTMKQYIQLRRTFYNLSRPLPLPAAFVTISRQTVHEHTTVRLIQQQNPVLAFSVATDRLLNCRKLILCGWKLIKQGHVHSKQRLFAAIWDYRWGLLPLVTNFGAPSILLCVLRTVSTYSFYYFSTVGHS